MLNWLRGHWQHQWQWNIMRYLTPSRRRVRTRGLQVTLSTENWLTYFRWQTFNTKEPETLDWIDQECRAGDMLFDIGANVGLYSLYVALRHPDVRVLAFEPEYSNVHLLKGNIMANQLQERINVYSIALSNRSGLSQIHLQDLMPGSAMHTVDEAQIKATRHAQPIVWREGIYGMRLDDFCQEISTIPNCIKIDVDGTEVEILEGAAQTLRASALRTILMEMPEDITAREQCQRMLHDAGWQCAVPATDSVQNEIWHHVMEPAMTHEKCTV